ncbi:MAG TPA: type II secretion system F family protein, partial [Polyangiaceae bacterium]|nr:type II secretion system F family protein [Polyangiaceae bacterium]
MTLAFKFGCIALFALAATALVASLASVPVPPAPRLGHRGAERRQALHSGGLFVTIEPLVRFMAGLAALHPLRKLREQQEHTLRRAGYCLGLTADELTALSFLSAMLLSATAFFVAPYADASPGLALPAFLVGAFLPTFQLQEVIKMRIKHVSRGLPHAIEIAAMCMGAGLDFPGALRLLTSPRSRDPLARELSLILEELDLGRTRREALLNFAERVPTQAVRDFVSAVVQAEQKGNPLAKVIQVQGRVLNMRRSVAAEEAAARAGV